MSDFFNEIYKNHFKIYNKKIINKKQEKDENTDLLLKTKKPLQMRKKNEILI